MSRVQLPPNIKKIMLPSGKIRYQVITDTGSAQGKRTQIRRNFKTEQEAKNKLAEVTSAVRSGVYVQVSKSTVEAVCEEWLTNRHSVKTSTLHNYRVWLAPFKRVLGDVDVQKLTKADVNKLVRGLAAGEVEGFRMWTPATVNGMLGLIRAVLDDLYKQGQVKSNVANLVDNLSCQRKEMKTLPEAAMFKILDYPDQYRHLWTLALYGLRRGEIAGLRWKMVDFDKGEIEIAENRRRAGKEVLTGTPKSLRSRRILPMPPEVMTVLKAAKEQSNSEFVAGDEIWRRPELLSLRWGDLLDNLGIERVRLHDARHTCGTIMHLRGVPISVISTWLGHSSSAFTMDRYLHANPESLREAAGAFKRSVTTSVTTPGDTPTPVTSD